MCHSLKYKTAFDGKTSYRNPFLQLHYYYIYCVILEGNLTPREVKGWYYQQNMKATGIVRRIDDLGRVVIPKEIRRTMRIREGEPLEIFVDREGEVILKKYSPIGELSEFAQEYADALAEETNNGVFVLDRDVIIAVSGVPRKIFIDKQISSDAEKVMEERRSKIINDKGLEAFCQGVGDSEYAFSSAVLAPIIVEGDPIGVVVMSNKEDGHEMGELEMKLTSTAASFLAKQMEQ